MKILWSVVALVLVGLTGGWLWMDATAEARQDTQGVVITGAVDPSQASSHVQSAPDIGAAAGGGLGLILSEASTQLFHQADEARQQEAAEAEAAEKEKKAKEQAAKEKAAKEQAAADKAAAERAAAQETAQPVPVVPAQPTGSCEWDDDDGWECEDDEWDDD